MKDLLLRLQPSSLEDVSAVLALYRPDSMPLLEDFIHNKHHPEDQTYLHPDMEEILSPTYGCMIYQEELMDIVRKFGGRSYGGADKFRKGIGKKDKELVKSESAKLHGEIVGNGYPEAVAKAISDDLSAKGGYLFNHCLAGDTKIMHVPGYSEHALTVEEMYKLRELFQKRSYSISRHLGMSFSLNEDKTLVENNIVDIRYAGIRTVYKLTLANGESVKATDNHKFPTPLGEKKLYELKVGDELYTRAKENVYTQIQQDGGFYYIIPTVLIPIVSIEECPPERVYDVEMAHPYHTFTLNNGIVSCNSHSALYSILTLKTAYLKAHYPTAFFCALFNQNRADYGALNKYLIDSQDFGVTTLRPHINKSQRYFSVADDKIRFGLEAIHGIGSKVVDAILSERENGRYTSLENLLSRVSLSTANVVALIKAGAIPCKNKRTAMLEYAKSLYSRRDYKPVSTYGTAASLLNDWDINVNDYKIGRKTDKEAVLAIYNQKRKIRHDIEQEAKEKAHLDSFMETYMADEEYWEFEALSVFLTDNPFVEAYKHINVSFDETEEGGQCVIVGIISGIQKKKDKNKNKYAFINLNALNGLFEVTCWSNQYKKYEELIKRGSKIAVLVKKNADKAVVEDIKPYEKWLEDRKIKLSGKRK